ncbi:DUF7282 domain-containing protein [Halorarum halobium]|uniref:DUF7282 domain-containing protein n=1 Tax=Halorarum halobium TaxID=3075121 RepID=UPI0028A9EE7C|nr:PGF-CTERM sorting domain-containing protein [Halobaculum sp. XH14]
MKRRTLISALVLLSAVVGVAALAGPVAAQETTETANRTASVEYDDQSIDATVTIAETTLPDGGFVAVYNQSGNYVGSSEYLSAGTHENVTVELEAEFTRGQVSVAQAYMDDGDESYAVGNETAYLTETNATVSDSAYLSSGDFSRNATEEPTATPESTGSSAPNTSTGSAATADEANGNGSAGDDGTETTTPGFTAVLALVAVVGAGLLARR